MTKKKNPDVVRLDYEADFPHVDTFKGEEDAGTRYAILYFSNWHDATTRRIAMLDGASLDAARMVLVAFAIEMQARKLSHATATLMRAPFSEADVLSQWRATAHSDLLKQPGIDTSQAVYDFDTSSTTSDRRLLVYRLLPTASKRNRLLIGLHTVNPRTSIVVHKSWPVYSD